MKLPEHPSSPIFIHALWRTGSTYLFNVFRRSGQAYWCYQEPDNECLKHLNGQADELLKVANDTVLGLRHPLLDRPYFWEFHQVKDALSGLFRKAFSYDDFFVDAAAGLPEYQNRYLGALISHAKGRPVLQFCRSAGRIGAIKRDLGGMHIHLWREPRNQWWSFKVNSYFDAVVQLIYNARELPPVLAEAKRRCDIVEFHSEDVGHEFAHAWAHPLSSASHYFAFYALWVYAYLEYEKYADITISIDRLSVEGAYRDVMRQDLARAGVEGLDLSDCSVPRTVFSSNECEFYEEIERQVRDLFLSHGYDAPRLDQVAAEHASVLEMREGEQPHSLRDAVRAREMTLRYLDQFTHAAALASEQERRALAAEVHGAAQEQRALAAEASYLCLSSQWGASQVRIRNLESQAGRAEAGLNFERERVRWLENELNVAGKKTEELHRSSHHWWTVAKGFDLNLQALYTSQSWRITKPVRILHSVLCKIVRGLSSIFRPRLAPPHVPAAQEKVESLSQLTPRARQIYTDLKAAVARHPKEPR